MLYHSRSRMSMLLPSMSQEEKPYLSCTRTLRAAGVTPEPGLRDILLPLMRGVMPPACRPAAPPVTPHDQSGCPLTGGASMLLHDRHQLCL